MAKGSNVRSTTHTASCTAVHPCTSCLYRGPCSWADVNCCWNPGTAGFTGLLHAGLCCAAGPVREGSQGKAREATPMKSPNKGQPGAATSGGAEPVRTLEVRICRGSPRVNQSTVAIAAAAASNSDCRAVMPKWPVLQPVHDSSRCFVCINPQQHRL